MEVAAGGPQTPSAPDTAKGKQARTTLSAKVPPPAGGAADKSLVELDLQSQAHAATIGYDAATWDAKELPPGCASRWDVDTAQRDTSYASSEASSCVPTHTLSLSLSHGPCSAKIPADLEVAPSHLQCM